MEKQAVIKYLIFNRNDAARAFNNKQEILAESAPAYSMTAKWHAEFT